MFKVEVIDAVDAARISGLSPAQIKDALENGKIILITNDVYDAGPNRNCPMIGTRAAALIAGVSESTIRNYADEGRVVCCVNLDNGYRKIWTTDASKIRRSRSV
jgi:hypothetical protein